MYYVLLMFLYVKREITISQFVQIRDSCCYSHLFVILRGVLLKEYSETGDTVNVIIYFDTLIRLPETVKKRRSGKLSRKVILIHTIQDFTKLDRHCSVFSWRFQMRCFQLSDVLLRFRPIRLPPISISSPLVDSLKVILK